MKKHLIFLLLSLVLVSCAGYEQITQEQRDKSFIETQPLDKDTAYDAVLEWLAKNFYSANNVIQLKDKDRGTIVVQAIGSYYYDILHTLVNNYHYTLTVNIKDQKIKLDFNTNDIVESGQLPQAKDLDDIYDNYSKIKDEIISYLKNYKGADNF